MRDYQLWVTFMYPSAELSRVLRLILDFCFVLKLQTSESLKKKLVLIVKSSIYLFGLERLQTTSFIHTKAALMYDHPKAQ